MTTDVTCRTQTLFKSSMDWPNVRVRPKAGSGIAPIDNGRRRDARATSPTTVFVTKGRTHAATWSCLRHSCTELRSSLVSTPPTSATNRAPYIERGNRFKPGFVR